ncbi:MAG TPA: metallophosphoesterase [Candidatus Acutalibacter stercorigallinarum]|nr:metallophosphoesterase [Candidatus Acutalibacter stercorigallinarum]
MDKRKRKRWIVLVALCALLACLIPYLLWANTVLTVSHVELDLLPGEGSFTIAQVSDLHNAEFGGGNGELLTILEEVEPDLIAITGDLIDSRRTDPAPALAFLEGAVELAPVCYVTGNHEFRAYDAYQDLKSQMEELGVIVLENESMVLEEVPLRVIGLDDPSFGVRSDPSATPEQILQGALTALAPQAGEEDLRTVLLAHRPEYVELYAQHGADLVLSGHAHGGQVRLPGVGGLYAPGQGFLPAYTSGLYQIGETSLVVSRGLGNSLFPLRVNNRPEVVLVKLA